MAFRAPWGPFCVAGWEQRRVLSLKSGHFNASRVSDMGRIAYMVLTVRASAGRGPGEELGKSVMAGYVEKTLAGGEEIIHRANFNWTYSFFPMLWFAIGAGSLVFYLLLQFAAGVPFAATAAVFVGKVEDWRTHVLLYTKIIIQSTNC